MVYLYIYPPLAIGSTELLGVPALQETDLTGPTYVYLQTAVGGKFGYDEGCSALIPSEIRAAYL